jgi:hypothetical protein
MMSGTIVRICHERLEELAAAMPEIAGHVGPGWPGVPQQADRPALAAWPGDRHATDVAAAGERGSLALCARIPGDRPGR